MNSAINTKKQPWGPFIKQVLGPNVPWAWYLGNLIARLSLANVMVAGYKLSGQIMSGEAVSDTAILWKYAGLMALSMGVTVAFTVSNSWAGYWTERKLQTRLWTKMIRMPMRLYDQQDPLSLISRVTEDTMLVTYSMSYLFTFLNSVYTLSLMLKEIWGMNRSITLALLLVLPYIWATMVIPGRFKFSAKKAVREKMSKLTGFVAERLTSITLVKSAANENADLQLGYEYAEELYKAKVKYWLIDGASQPFTYGIEGIVSAIILISGSILVQDGRLDMAGLMTMFAMRSTIYNYMLQFVFCFHYIKDAQGSTAKIAELMAVQPEVLARERSFTQPEDDIAFENVSFRYDDKDVIQNVSVIIPKGKVTAIVGPSGAGKTTLLSLLERLYTPNEGQIRFGDTPVEKIHLDQWRGAMGYIQQASPLLSGTIRDNIVYGLNRPAKDEEVVKAAKTANAYDFIMELPDGFDTDIGQLGGKLSGGERQRIAIARMIIKDPDYLLLDEATSSLDAENEAEVQAALSAVMAGRTAVVVAHNLRTVVNADNIIVMDQGRIQATGTHQSLYGSNELYTRYFDLQFAR